MRYDSIKTLEVEISTFSGGGYKVKYDFVRNLISWNDGYMWNNNFCKSLTPNRLEIIKTRLPDTELFDWMEAYNKGEYEEIGTPSANPSSWKVTVIFDDGTSFVSSKTKHWPKKWAALKSVIEDTTECTFRLR